MKHRIAALAAAAMLCITGSLTAAAFSDELEELMYDHIGGLNFYNGVNYGEKGEPSEREAEMQQLESTLRNDGYICLFGKYPDVKEEDYQKYLSCFPREEDSVIYAFYHDVNTEYSTVYVYEPAWDYIMAETLKGVIDTETDVVVAQTIVHINRQGIESIKKVGTHSDEWGDNIKDEDCAYIKVTTPINVVITFESNDTHVFYDIPFEAGKTTIKIRRGNYLIRNINSITVDDDEELLPFKNNINISKENGDKKHAYNLELQEFANKYLGTGDKIDSGKVSDDNYEVSAESVEIVPEKENKSNKAGTVIIIIFLSFVLAGGILFYMSKHKKDDEDDEEEE